MKRVGYRVQTAFRAMGHAAVLLTAVLIFTHAVGVCAGLEAPQVSEALENVFAVDQQGSDDAPGKQATAPLVQSLAIGLVVAGAILLVAIVYVVVLHRRLNSRTSKSEAKYRQLVDNAHDLIVVVQDRMVTFANPTAKRVLGYGEDELSRLSLAEVIHPCDHSELFDTPVVTADSVDQPAYHTFRAVTKKGAVRWLQMNAVRIDWEERPAALCMIRDITESKEMETRLFQAEKMQAVGTLAGGVAHDFNNILAAILGYTELCKMKIGPKDQLHQNLDQILKAGRRAKDLVSQILTFSHQKDKDQKPIDLDHSLRDALKLIKATLPTSIEMRHNLGKVSGIVVADPSEIYQIMMNLCTNAAHAMQEKGGTIDIKLQRIDVGRHARGMLPKLEPGGYMRLTVVDTGRGMTPSTLQRIFEPYFSTKQQGEGTGLGLSMVHGIVQGLGGLINVDSKPGSGTTFEIYLPRLDAQEQNDTMPMASDVIGGHERLLVVDDERVVLEMTKEMLTQLGYQVIGLSSSLEAIDTFKATPDAFDLIITDQTMPNMTGKQFASRALAVRPDIPIILCTGFSTAINEQSAMEMGIRVFVRKPILRSELATAVRQALDGQLAGADRKRSLSDSI